MAGDWLKIETGLPEKSEVWDIAETLGVDPDLVVGKLIKVWRWFDQHTENGNAHRVTYFLIDHVAGITGFGEAMSFAGWLLQDGKDLVLPNFDRHNGKTAKNRALTAKRVAEHKAKNGNDKVTMNALPREEKRREDIKANTPIVPLTSTDDLLGHSVDPNPSKLREPQPIITAVLHAYHTQLPHCTRVNVLNPKREKRILTADKLARTVCRQQGWKYAIADFWGAYFAECAKDPWLRGDIPNPKNPAWRQNLEVLLAEDRFAKLMDQAIDGLRGDA